MSERNDVFISSTSHDLPQHRKEAIDACLRMGMFPMAMEQLPAVDSNSIDISLKMCDAAEIYLGIFAHRYGYIPNDYDISITEMEYNRAVERGIPRLIFVMHEDHLVKGSDIEKGESAVKLHTFKQRLLTDNVVNFFKSPEDLRGKIIHSLIPYRQEDPIDLHPRYANDIPRPPEPYIAHPYTLLQTSGLVGREKELSMLTEWAKKPGGPIFSFVVAIGGMGKSALIWKWFNDKAPKVIPDLRGRIWWSFYESDASFENFITRALAYASRQPKDKIIHLSRDEKEVQLLGLLNQETHLIVLDGLERTLIAYARMDATRMLDDDLDQSTANYSDGNLPDALRDSFVSRHHLRKTIDPRVGVFLRKLTHIKKSRILVSSRLYPAELQSVTGEPILGSELHFLEGLEDSDAINLWYSLGMRGSREALLSVFHSFGNYPLLIRALAGEIANYRRAPGDFDRWQRDNPDFAPTKLPAVQAKSHVLSYALKGLDSKKRRLLQLISAFRMPTTYSTLASLVVNINDLFSSESQLDTALSDLEDRGLVGWDKRGNRYDLHPIVRSVVWNLLEDKTKQDLYTSLSGYFGSIPSPTRPTRLEDLTSTLELFHTLIGLQKFDEAWMVYNDHLRSNLYYHLGEYQVDIQLLQGFKRTSEGEPRIGLPTAKTWICLYEGMCYERTGNPLKAYELMVTGAQIARRQGNLEDLSIALVGCTTTSWPIGAIARSVEYCQEAIQIAHSTNNANWIGIAHRSMSQVYMLMGDRKHTIEEFQATDKAYDNSERFQHGRSILATRQAQSCLDFNDVGMGIEYAKQAIALSKRGNYFREFTEAIIVYSRLLSKAYLQNKFEQYTREAENYAIEALHLVRKHNIVDLESDALLANVDFMLARCHYDEARVAVSEALRIAEESHYRIKEVDCLNLLSDLLIITESTAQAIEVARRAYKKSWCDGTPFVYYWGLANAKRQLDSLNAPYPGV